MQRLLIWVLFFPMAGAVCASLGDDADKIEDSYGSLTSRHLRDDGTVAVVYQKDRYVFGVTFDHGLSVAEEYSRVDRATLSEKEIAKFLKMNAGAKLTWSAAQANKPGQGRRFERSDHKAEATLSTRASLRVERR